MPPGLASSQQSPQANVYDNSTAATTGSENATAGPDGAARAMVQIMALSNSEDAESMVIALKRHGYNEVIAHEPLDPLLHLEVGPFASKTDAEAMRQRLLLDGYNATISNM
jgi:cell division septation protein DedD